MTVELHACDGIRGRLSFSTSLLRFGDEYARVRTENVTLIVITLVARGATISARSRWALRR